MIKGALLSVSIMVMAGTCISVASVSDVYAISGCCKERVSADEPWYRSGTDLEACKARNAIVDEHKDTDNEVNDNIFNESGKVWWDIAC